MNRVITDEYLDSDPVYKGAIVKMLKCTRRDYCQPFMYQLLVMMGCGKSTVHNEINTK